MTSFLFLNNIHLGLELLGAAIFFLAALIFFEGFIVKTDMFGLARALGFLFLAGWQLLHALSVPDTPLISGNVLYLASLILIALGYGLERLPPKPSFSAVALFPPALAAFFYGPSIHTTASLLLFLITLVLTKRYIKDIERQVKWLAVGFFILFLSSVAYLFSRGETFGQWYILEHVIKIAAFLAIGLWIGFYLSFRIREKMLLVFVGTSLFITLLLTTTFSFFFLEKIVSNTTDSLAANAKVFQFYIESLQNKALASSQLIADNKDFISAVVSKDISDLERIAQELTQATGQQFLTVAQPNGRILFKYNFPIVSGENILTERIGAEALEGRLAATFAFVEGEGFLLRAAAPIFDQGEIIGALVSGFLLDDAFVENFRKISKLETTVFAGNKAAASTLLKRGDILQDPAIEEKVLQKSEEFVGTARLFNQLVIGAFLPLKNIDEETIGMLSLTTTPGELLRDAQATNQLTLFIIFLIVLALVIPLYRFTVFLTSS